MSRLALLSVVSLLALAGCDQGFSSGKDQDPSVVDSGIVDTGDTGDTGADTDTAADADTDTDADTDADSDADTDADTDADSDADTDADTDTDPGWTCDGAGPEAATWVVDTLVVGTASEGVDLDGDGTADNVMALAKASLDASLADTLATSSTVIVLQFWDVDDWCDDDIHGGFLTATDTDGNLADNASGSESFDPGAEVDASGHAVMSAAATITGGEYRVTIPSASMEVGGYVLESVTGVVVEGTATEHANVGVMGFAISVATMVPIAEANGLSRDLVERLADIDADGDGVNDALSIAFVFTSVPCGLR